MKTKVTFKERNAVIKAMMMLTELEGKIYNRGEKGLADYEILKVIDEAYWSLNKILDMSQGCTKI